jgi:NAD(P)-dependent dehydrogenase (short-subunit alcohol dehydrogenase family)
MGRFDAKVAWVTGGGSGIGKACSLELAREGAVVAVSGRRLEKLEATVAAIEALGGKALAVPCDVTDEEAVKAAVATVVETLGGIDVLLANAGFSSGGKVMDVPDEAWRRQFDVNVFGLLNCVRVSGPHLHASGGRIGLLGSVMGFLTVPKNGPYAASKAAVRSISETLAMELADTGVSCTGIHPGFVESEIAQVGNDGVFDADRADKRPAQLMWKAEDAARVIVRGLHKRKRELVVTGHGKVFVALSRMAPSLVALLGRKI